jgi:hypothetical protein
VVSCDIVLVVIGNGWLDAADEWGCRRLDDPNDFVALEIMTGLNRNIPVIPILVDGAAQVREDKLPAALTGLARRQSVRLDHESFSADVGKLMRVLDRVFASRRTQTRPLGLASLPARPSMQPNAPVVTAQPGYAAPTPPVEAPPWPFPNAVPGPTPRPRWRGRRLAVISVVTSLLGIVAVVAVVASSIDAPLAAGVGDCLAQTRGRSLSEVNCTDNTARFRVVGRMANKTAVDASLDACKPFPKATSSYWEGESGKPGLVLCLEVYPN